ncbi:MAG: hypothetical protein ACI9P7_002382 [Candidatus Azotimanducaceae bacterium]|jgi:hypothetical protein
MSFRIDFKSILCDEEEYLLKFIDRETTHSIIAITLLRVGSVQPPDPTILPSTNAGRIQLVPAT